MLRIRRQHRLTTGNGADLAIERGDRELIVPAVLPLHVSLLAIDAQPDMVGHAGRRVADLELSAGSIGETEADLRDVMHLAAGDHCPDIGRHAFEWLPRQPNLLVVRTFSKIHGLAGLRLGYGVGSPGIPPGNPGKLNTSPEREIWPP